MAISALSTPPNRGQTPDVFNAAADAFMAGLPQFVNQLNAMGTLFNLATTTTSSTSNTIAVGAKTFTVAAGLGYTLGMPLTLASTASPTNNMYGVVTAYSSTTLTVQVSAINGTGTFTAWSISLAAASIGAGLGTNTFSGVQNWNQGTSITAASTIDLTNATGNTVVVNGTTNVNAFTLGNGMFRYVIFGGVLTLNYNATTMRLNTGGANYTVTVQDVALVNSIDGIVYVYIIRADGKALTDQVISKSSILPISASVAANALTVTLNPCTLDFRSSALGSGVVNTRTIGTVLSLTVSSGSTLGSTSGQLTRFAVLALDVGGTIELAIVNVGGGDLLDELGLITTVAEGGAGGADLSTTAYSTVARSNVPYRVVGMIETSQTAAGVWATQPTLVQGGGLALSTAMAGMGFGQTWKTVAKSINVNYYNTTGKPIFISVKLEQDDGVLILYVDGIMVGRTGSTQGPVYYTLTAIVPVGSYYQIGATQSTIIYNELS